MRACYAGKDIRGKRVERHFKKSDLTASVQSWAGLTALEHLVVGCEFVHVTERRQENLGSPT